MYERGIEQQSGADRLRSRPIVEMDATDLEEAFVQLGAEDDTIEEFLCALCAARDGVESALLRYGVEQVTIVSRYTRPPIGTACVERTSAMICREGVITKGEGHSREEALVDALAQAGCRL